MKLLAVIGHVTYDADEPASLRHGVHLAAQARLLLLDRDESRQSVLAHTLGSICEVIIVQDLREATSASMGGNFDIGAAAYSLDGSGSGIEFLQNLQLIDPTAFRVLYSSFYCRGMVREATRIAGAHGVLDANEVGFVTNLNSMVSSLLASRAGTSNEAHDPEPPPWCAVSSISRRFLAELRHAACSRRAVFLWGEPGTGKDLACRTLRGWRNEWTQRVPCRPRHMTLPPAVIKVPALRDRLLDVPHLSRFLLSRIQTANQLHSRPIATDALAVLSSRSWAGNVSELQIVLQRADTVATSCGSPTITGNHVPTDLTPRRRTCDAAKDEGQRQAILCELQATGSVRAAAKLEGIDRGNYTRMMRRLGVVRADAVNQNED